MHDCNPIHTLEWLITYTYNYIVVHKDGRFSYIATLYCTCRAKMYIPATNWLYLINSAVHASCNRLCLIISSIIIYCGQVSTIPEGEQSPLFQQADWAHFVRNIQLATKTREADGLPLMQLALLLSYKVKLHMQLSGRPSTTGSLFCIG